MAQPARVLSPADLRHLLRHAHHTKNNARSETIVLLSFKAGLRACEIAGLDWHMVSTPDGKIAHSIDVAGTIAKNGRCRRIPLNASLRLQLIKLHAACGKPLAGPVIKSQRGGHMTARAVVNWFANVYQELGFAHCSSHSGRRTFITQAAKLVAKSGGSLRDVQELAGHRALTTTERYIEGDRDAQRKLVQLI